MEIPTVAYRRGGYQAQRRATACIVMALIFGLGLGRAAVGQGDEPKQVSVAAVKKAGDIAVNPGAGGSASSTSPPSPPTHKITRVVPASAGVGDDILVEIDDLPGWLSANQLEAGQLVLYLDGQALKGVNPRWSPSEPNRLRFTLVQSQVTDELWSVYLSRPQWTRKIAIGVGPEGDSGKRLYMGTPPFELIVMPRSRFYLALIAIVLSLVLFLRLSARTAILRDITAPDRPLAEKPFSMARVQMAIWYFLILGAFLFVWVIRSETPAIPDQILGLIGIAAGTALGSTIIDLNRPTPSPDLTALQAQRQDAVHRTTLADARVADAQAHLRNLAAGSPDQPASQAALTAATTEQEAGRAEIETIDRRIADARIAAQPRSEGFFVDLLTDDNGISFHRFQILVWTVVLGLLFVVEVWRQVQVPTFSNSLLALMGLSNGTYLGFKIPEKAS